MEDRLLLKSSENISKLLTLFITHENNIKNRLRQQSEYRYDIQFIIGRALRNLNNMDLSNNMNNDNDSLPDLVDPNIDVSLNQPVHTIEYTTFNEIQSPNDIMCSITHDFFNLEDEVALLGCGHYFKKSPFLIWSLRHNTCPVCRARFRN
jgi:hypothetical protein